MEFLGVGPLELFFILIIALIVIGPKDMVKTGKTIGKFLRRLVTSPTWQAVQQTSRDLRYLPNRLMREAGLEEEMQDLKKISSDVNQLGNFKKGITADLIKTSSEINQELSSWTTPPPTISPVIESPPPPAVSQVIEPPPPPVESSQSPSPEDQGSNGEPEEPIQPSSSQN